ncbi:MAG: choice-of-anchor Q domain-containing protein [Alcanivoracaceae bacterium]|nr:choice-of-anchor Q domain-containing protein [Alcanivoracaceae bacterium]
MFHRSSVSLVAVTLMALSATASATNYDIGTRSDLVAADGLCSVREAVNAINTQRGYIGDVASDERGVTLAASAGGVSQLSFVKEVRNVSNNGSFLPVGSRLLAERGDLLEYRITVEADEAGGDIEGVTLQFLFPHEDATVIDPLTGTWRSYVSSYVAGSTLLNGVVVEDVADSFPLANPAAINDANAGEDDLTFAEGKIREGNKAEIVFRARVEAGDDEAVSEDLPEVENEIDTEYLVEAECPAGTIANTIFLKSVLADSEDPAVVYQLCDDPGAVCAGALVLGGGQDRDGRAVNPGITFEPMREDAFDREEKKNVQIKAAANRRVFDVRSGATLTLKFMSVVGAGVLPAGQNGGLMLVLGTVNINEGSLLTGGEAENGGAIYLDGNRTVSFSRARFENNHATANGGAIASASTFRGGISGSRFHFIGNSADGDGGAIYLDGQAPSIFADNGTFYDNSAVDGSAIRIATDERSSGLNNVTIVANDASAGAALSYRTAATTTVLYDELYNSAVLGNIGGDCAADDGPATAGSDLTLDLAQIAYVVSTGAADAPTCGPLDAEYLDPFSGEPFDYSLVDFSLLLGNNPAITDPLNPAFDDRFECGPAAGATSCRPMTFDDGLQGFLPNNGVTLPAPTAGHIEPSLVSAGSPEDAVFFVCASTDQRELNREPRCDAGSVELQIAAGTDEEFRLVQGQEVLLDVLANDMGDLVVDCTPLTDPLACLQFFLPPRQTEVVPLNWVSGLVSPANPDGETRVTVVPDREGVYLNRLPLADEEEMIFPAGYPLILHTPLQSFHGVDQFRYYLDSDAVDGPTYAAADPSANSNLVVEAESGLSKKEDITTLGSFGWLGLISLMSLLLRRLRILLPLPVLLFAAQVQAADIIVNTLEDSADLNALDGDGNPYSNNKKCSLREALFVSIDRSPFFFPDCISGETGRDRIIIDLEGDIELEAVLDIFSSNIDIEGQGPGKTVIRPAPGNQHRVIQATSLLTLRNLTIADGYTTDNGGAIFTNASLTLENVELRDNQALGNGGAIYLNYNAELSRTFTMNRSYAHGNQAGINGGVFSMVGQNRGHDVVFDGVTFSDNTAPNGAGGALDINLPFAGSARIVNSTFVENDALAGAAIDLQQMDSAVNVYIINSTVLDAAAPVAPGAGVIELGDNSGRISLSNSTYVGSRECTTGTKAFERLYYNLFSAPTPATCTAELPANDVANNEANSADILDVLNDGVLAGEQFADDRYIPPHLPIVAEALDNPLTYPAGPFIIDAGNTEELVSGNNSPRACRTLDLRGTSRESGGRCDIGAYELQVPTAIDDSTTNKTNSARVARVDVLFNDLPGDGVPDVADEIVDNEVLRGTIDLDPSNPAVTPSNSIVVPVEGGGSRTFTVSKVFDGQWQFDNSADVLEPGVYEIGAVVYNSNDVFVANARQTLIVRDPDPESDLDEDAVEFVTTGGSALQIQTVSGDADGDFIVDDGGLIISGRSDSEDGSRVELFIDDRELGEVDLSRDPGACGGESGAAVDEACIVLVEPVDALQCSDFEEGGFEVVFPYTFMVFNQESNQLTTSTSAEVTVTFDNVSPLMESESIRSKPGRTEVFTLDINDPDGVVELLDTTGAAPVPRITLETPPKFASSVLREVDTGEGVEFLPQVFGIEGYGTVDPEFGRLSGVPDGLGLVVREDAGVITVTYTPRDSLGQFNDRFVLGYRDQCGAERSAEFRVLYPDAEANAGSVGYWWMMAMILLVGGRTRRLSQG